MQDRSDRDCVSESSVSGRVGRWVGFFFYLRNMGTTVLLLTSVMLGHRFSTSHALPNTVSASALHTQYGTRVGQDKEEKNVRNKERGRGKGVESVKGTIVMS